MSSATCVAQPPVKSAGEMEAEMMRDLRGDRALTPMLPDRGSLVPSVTIGSPVPERPTGDTVTVHQLGHKVSKDVAKSFTHAEQLWTAGKHAQAAEELEKIVKQDPMFAGGYDMLGVEYGQLGRFRDAETTLQRSIELDPNLWVSHYNLAVVKLKSFDLSAAERNCRRAVELAPSEARAHLLLGYLLYTREESRQEGLDNLRFAARTMDEAKEFLRNTDRQ
jgi:tetratricopeptide (TPR) repeat protein